MTNLSYFFLNYKNKRLNYLYKIVKKNIYVLIVKKKKLFLFI